MKPALMILDLQKAYCNGDTQKSMDEASQYINAILSAFRRKKLPVIWVQHIDKDWGVIPGTEGFDFIDSLKPDEGEYRIHKEYGNAFNKTNCVDIIKQNNIDTVIVAGFCAEYCVLSTCRGAMDVDLTPIIIKNSIASGSKENIRFVEEISNVMTYDVLGKVLENI